MNALDVKGVATAAVWLAIVPVPPFALKIAVGWDVTVTDPTIGLVSPLTSPATRVIFAVAASTTKFVVVVFGTPAASKDIVKRVVAVPLSTVTSRLLASVPLSFHARTLIS